MTVSKRSSWLPMAGLAVALASILAFLYDRTRSDDDSSYFENVALLRQLKQLDARWELDVLKSKMGITSNYDSLVDPLVELIQLRNRLQTIVTTQQPASGAIVASDHVSDPYWLWCSSETRPSLLLLTAPDSGSTCLRTQNRKTRYRRNQPRVFPKQRVR